MTTRRIGLTKPNNRLSMPPDSQSQDSTQQPSIEIRPAAPSTPFRPPLLTVPEASAEQLNPSEESSSLDPSSISQGVSGSSIEETGDSGVAWTQSQLKLNGGVEEEGIHQDDGKEEGQENLLKDIQEESEDGVITSPELPARNTSPPKWRTKSPSPPPLPPRPASTRPSSPTTEKDELNSSLVDIVAPDQPLGLEETEVDIPDVPTPDQSERQSSSPQPRPVPKSPLVQPSRQLRGVTSYSPSKLTPKSHTANGSNRQNRSATTSPLKPFTSKRSFVTRKKKEESLGSDESQFGKEAIPSKFTNPLERLGTLMQQNSANNFEVANGRLNGKNPSITLPDGTEDQEEDRLTNPNESPDDHKEETDKEGGITDQEEDEQEGVNWVQSIPGENGNHLSNNSQSDQASPHLPNGNLTSSSPPQRLPERTHFNQFANSGSVASQNGGELSGGLFSDVDEEVGDLPETQQSTHFAATQMVVREPSSPAFESLPENPSPGDALEATQPQTQLNDPETNSNGNVPINDIPQSPPLPPRQALSRAPSNLSTASKFSVPANRQLARRSKVDEGSFVSPITFNPPDNIPPTILPSKTSALPPKPDRSEAALGPVESSPFKKATPPRTSSEPPMMQEALQNSHESASSSAEDNIANKQPQEHEINRYSPVQPNLQFTSPPKSPTPDSRASSPTSPSLNARRPPDPPALTPVLEETQTDSPSLPPAPPPRISPKQYKGLNKRKRVMSTPVSDARDTPDTDSDSSTAPDDEEDHTYRPAPKDVKKRKPNYPTSAASSSKNPSTPSAPEFLTTKRERKRVIRSSSLSNPPSDDESSSDAPEDPEDNTYQPSLLPKPTLKMKLDKGKGKEKASTPSSTASSRLPVTKKQKTNAQVAALSPSVSNASVPSSSAKSETIPVLAAYINRYYAGKAKWSGKGYKVDFEDGEKKDNVKPDKMRKLILRKRDQLEACTESKYPAKFEVAQDWDGETSGVKCRSLEGMKLGRVPFSKFGISVKVIHSSFGDRLFEDPRSKRNNGIPGPTGDRLNGVPRRVSVPRSPVKRANGHGSPSVSRRSTSPIRPTSDKLKGMLFIPTRGLPGPQHEMATVIRFQGGKIATSWEELFDRSSPGECGFNTNLSGTPFLILMGEGKEGTIITPKVMVALAKGIPCLSARYIDDIVEQNEKPDWRSYLISPGFSNHVEHHMSQVIDINWGQEGWEAHSAGPIRKPLKGKRILFVLPTSKNEGLKRLVPVCLYAMGVIEFLSVPNLKSSEISIQDKKWDYILFEDREYKDKDGRDKTLPKYLSAEKDRLCNVHWLKQCLIMGSALPPSLDAEKDLTSDKEKDRKK